MYFMYHSHVLPSLHPLLPKGAERQEKKPKGESAKYVIARLVGEEHGGGQVVDFVGSERSAFW